ncbi:hypothetical protein [Ghiorsea bivora]|uniref:hypothetical protein n=1 Tax=Ghiorsea bivora TaxID=1485545 RepID=UPI00056EAE10|nr:hypothetical protein [Ghiorsea bivora]
MFRISILIALIITHISASYAFYVSENDMLSQEARGLLLLGSGVIDSDTSHFLSTRLMYDINADNWHVEYQQIWQQTFFANIDTYQTKADRLNISYSNDNVYLKAGRQAISLTTTFFFSPNDFFAPFTIQSLNRDFKQGVDALYAETPLGELSQLSAVWVNNRDEDIPASSILRFESVFSNISWMVLAGEIHQTSLPTQQVLGGSIQTDLGNLGIRAEGHVSTQNKKTSAEWVLGLEQRLSSDITLSGEWFNHGAAFPTPHLPYTGKQYLALALNCQFTPLLLGNFSIIKNINDQSQLGTAYINYSLSNESTLNVSILLPSGKTLSEFTTYPKLYALDYQIYF